MTYRLRASRGQRRRAERRSYLFRRAAELGISVHQLILREMYPQAMISRLAYGMWDAGPRSEEERNRKRGKRRKGRRVDKGVAWWRRPPSPLFAIIPRVRS